MSWVLMSWALYEVLDVQNSFYRGALPSLLRETIMPELSRKLAWDHTACNRQRGELKATLSKSKA